MSASTIKRQNSRKNDIEISVNQEILRQWIVTSHQPDSRPSGWSSVSPAAPAGSAAALLQRQRPLQDVVGARHLLGAQLVPVPAQPHHLQRRQDTLKVCRTDDMRNGKSRAECYSRNQLIVRSRAEQESHASSTCIGGMSQCRYDGRP